MLRIRRAGGPVAALVAATVAVTGAAQAIAPARTKTGIAYDVRGRGPAVVLITGSNLDRRMWARDAEWLAPTHTVVRYDLRAHGSSDGATAPFSNVGDLLAVLDELDIRKATLIGLSAGSTIAIDAVLQEPARFERIIVAGPAVSGFVTKQTLPFAGDLVSALQQRDYARASEVLLASPVFEVPPSARPLVRAMVTENDRLWSVPRELMKAPDSTAVNRLGEISIPMLVLIGERDVFQREQADLLARDVRGARLVVVPGGGHLLNLTSPDEFKAEVSRFLR